MIEVFNKTPAEQRDTFRPKLLHNDIDLRLKNSQSTMKVVIHLGLFLVGTFSLKEKRVTITVVSFF